MGKRGPERGQKRAAKVRRRRRAQARRARPAVDPFLDGEPLELFREELRDVVGETVAERDPFAAREYFDAVVESVRQGAAEGADDADLPLDVTLMLLTDWLRGIREAHPHVEPAPGALAWIGAELGAEAAQLARLAGRMLGAADPGGASMEALFEEQPDDVVPALVWLVAGAVATLGEGDPEWLRQFDAEIE